MSKKKWVGGGVKFVHEKFKKTHNHIFWELKFNEDSVVTESEICNPLQLSTTLVTCLWGCSFHRRVGFFWWQHPYHPGNMTEYTEICFYLFGVGPIQGGYLGTTASGGRKCPTCEWDGNHLLCSKLSLTIAIWTFLDRVNSLVVIGNWQWSWQGF